MGRGIPNTRAMSGACALSQSTTSWHIPGDIVQTAGRNQGPLAWWQELEKWAEWLRGHVADQGLGEVEPSGQRVSGRWGWWSLRQGSHTDSLRRNGVTSWQVLRVLGVSVTAAEA